MSLKRKPDVLAVALRRDVEHLEPVAFEHHDLLRARVVGEADDLLGRDLARVDGDVDTRVLEDLLRGRVVDDRDREAGAVHLRERGGEVVLHVVAHGEDRDLRVRDPLALEEVRVEAGRVVDARGRELRGDVPGPLAGGLDQAHADPLLEQEPCDGDAGAAGAEDDDVRDRAGAGRDQLAPELGGLRRADHDDAVAGAEIVSSPRGITTASSRMIAATRESGGSVRLAQRCAEQARVGLLGDVELDHLHLPLGEGVRLARRRDADRPRDRVRRLDLGGDDEVDVELALPPDLEVLGVRRADDRRRPVRAGLRDHRRDDVRLVARRARDQEVGLGDPSLGQDAAAGAVALQRGDVVALRDRGQPLLVEVDHGQLVLVVERLDDRRADLAGADDEDLHRRRVLRRGVGFCGYRARQ